MYKIKIIIEIKNTDLDINRSKLHDPSILMDHKYTWSAILMGQKYLEGSTLHEPITTRSLNALLVEILEDNTDQNYTIYHLIFILDGWNSSLFFNKKNKKKILSFYPHKFVCPIK